MSEININVSFPLDDERFFRRECPFCKKEFKILIDEKELDDLAHDGIELFLIESDGDEIESENSNGSAEDFFCPYCGQQASKNSFWTEEQLAYIKVIIENISTSTELINKEMERKFRSSKTISFKHQEQRLKEPWISPEENDMLIFALPCCSTKIKIIEDWGEAVYCYYCGFPHKQPTNQ